MKTITSLQNPLVKQIMTWLEKSKERKKDQMTVIEGEKEVEMAIKAEAKIEQILFYPSLLSEEKIHFWLKNVHDKPELIEISEQVFQKLAYREGSGGFLALVKTPQISLENIVLSPNPLLIILEKVEKPGNLGAILRTADAVGADAVLICDPLTDCYNPNVIRASLGCVFTQKVVACRSEEAQTWLKKHQITTFAAFLGAETLPWKANFRQKTALVMGTEHDGLSQKWIDFCHEKIKIPMLGAIDSLNVSTATAILAYEALRQRTNI